MEIIVESASDTLVAEFGGTGSRSLPQRIDLTDGVTLILHVERPSGFFPVEGEIVRLLIEMPTAIGVGVVSNWLWHRLQTRKRRVLIERSECIFETAEELHKLIYERWRVDRS